MAIHMAYAKVRTTADESGILAARIMSPLLPRAERAKLETALECASGRGGPDRFEATYGPKMVEERERVLRQQREWIERKRKEGRN